MTTQNLKRKKNNNLKDQKRVRTSKVPAITKPFPTEQAGKRAEEALHSVHEELEIRVQERTTELMSVVEALQDEMAERKRAEEALQRSEEVTKRLAQEKAIMAEIGRIISSTLDIEEVYERFAEEAHKLIPFDGIAVNIINHKEGTVTVPYVSGISVPGCQPRDIFPLEGSVTGEVMRMHSGMITQTKDRKELQTRFPTLLTAFDTGLRSLIAVPLISKDQVIGAIHFRSTKPNAYSDQNLKLAEDIASQIAGAIANGQLFMEHKQTEEALRSEHDKFRGMLSALGDGVDIVNKNYIIEFQNELLRERYGDKIGEKCFSAYMGLERPCDFCSIQEAIRTGHPTRIELDAPDGRNYELNSSPFMDVDGEVKVIELVRDITERKRAEEVLQASEANYRAIFNAANDAIFIHNMETGEILDVNKKMCEMYGYTLEEARRINVEVLSSGKPPYTQEDALRWIKKAVEGYPQLFEWRAKDKDGRLFWVEVNLKCATVGGKERLLAIVRDITERKKVEEAFVQSGERYRTLVEESFDGIFIQKYQKIVFSNRRLHEMLGYEEGELLGRDHWLVYHPDYQELTRQRAQARMRGENVPSQYEVKLQRKDGSSFDGEINARKIMFGNEPGIQVWVRDITERKRTEETLRQSEAKYRIVADNTYDWEFWLNPEGHFAYISPSCKRITGHDAHEFVADPNLFDRIIHPEDFPLFDAHRHKAMREMVPGEVEFRIVCSDGTSRWISHVCQPIFDTGGTFLGTRGSNRDITERKRAEEALRTEKQRFQTLSENAPFGMVMIDKDGTFKYINPKFREIFGYNLTDVPNGKTWFRKAYPNPTYRHDVIEAWINDLKSSKSGEKRPRIFTVTCKDGTEKTINFIPVQLEASEHLMSCEDITERKQAVEALRESEEKYRNILDNIEDGYYEVDNAGNFTFFNNSLCKILGYSKEEMTGMNNRVYMDKETTRRVYQAFNQVYTTDEPLKAFGYKIKREDGIERFLESHVSLLRNTNGERIGFRGIARDMTERKQAEEGLKDSEERYRKLFENAIDGIVLADLERGIIIDCNKVIGGLVEREKTELIGQSQQILHPPEDSIGEVSRTFAQHRIDKEGQVLETQVITKTGEIKQVEIKANILELKGRKVLQGIFRDITERKNNDEKILRQSALLDGVNKVLIEALTCQTEEEIANKCLNVAQALTKSKFGFIGEINQSGRFDTIAMSDPGWEACRIPRSDSVLLINNMEMRGIWASVLKEERSLIVNDPAAHPNRVGTPEGHPPLTSFLGVPLKHMHKTIGMIALANKETVYDSIDQQDIETLCTVFVEALMRKRAEEARRESEEKYRILFEGSRDAVYITTREGNLINFNQAFLDLFGYSKEELAVLNARDTYANPGDRYRFRQEIEQKGVVRDYEVKLRKKDGTEIDCLLTSSMRRDNDGSILGYQGIIRDITARKRSEQEMAALQEQFRQSQKMEAVGRLGGGIAHDFNNLLTIIKGYSQLSLLDLKESDPLWGNIQEIQKATQRATDLTRQLLAFSRRQILDLKVLDLNALLKDLNKMLRRIIGEDIELTTLLAEDLGRVKIDPGQIEQVIFNLAVNARDAMPSGGKLIIETANVELDREYANAHIGVVPGRYVRLSVSDTGFGMSQEVREKVFEPFFTTKDKGKGTGLGLSTVYGIVKQSGGNIWVYSEPGHGTTFKIYLPRVEEELDTLHGQDETDSLPRGSETVLLVEDEPSVRNLAHRLLNQHGYKVLEAANGEEALRVAQEHIGEKIHLLLTDVVMPQMGGKELAEKLKLLRADIKILYTSGYTDNAIVHHGVLEPGTHFLQKPFSPKTLLHKVREVLDR